MSMIRKTPEQLWAQLDEMFADPKVMLRVTQPGPQKAGGQLHPKVSATLVDTEALLDANQNGYYLRHPSCPG